MLHEIQSKVKAPKDQNNEFGKFKYRNAERILEHAKPILGEMGCHLIMSDDIVEVGGRVYVKATVKLFHEEKLIGEAYAFAREQELKKGMDEAQITGSCSSYARKYALCGLFAIDDSRDDLDSKDNRSEGDPVELINRASNLDELKSNFEKAKKLANGDLDLLKQIGAAKDKMKMELAA